MRRSGTITALAAAPAKSMLLAVSLPAPSRIDADRSRRAVPVTITGKVRKALAASAAPSKTQRDRTSRKRGTLWFVSLSNRTLRTYLWLALFLALRAVGNLALAIGTRRFPETLAADPTAYLRSMLDPFIAAGIVMLIVALLARLALLSVADLSFVLPMTAIGYVIAALMGRIFLHEAVSPQRWLAVTMIFAGAALVSSTPQSTTGKPDKAR